MTNQKLKIISAWELRIYSFNWSPPFRVEKNFLPKGRTPEGRTPEKLKLKFPRYKLKFPR